MFMLHICSFSIGCSHETKLKEDRRIKTPIHFKIIAFYTDTSNKKGQSIDVSK